MASTRRLIHKLEPQHLAVLQWLDWKLPDDDGPMPFIEEPKIQNAIRFTEDMKLAPISPRDGKRHGERLAIGEHLHDLTYQLSAEQEPFVIVHQRSGKHYGISANGRSIARKCAVELRSDAYGAKVPTVIDKAKGKPPLLQSIETTARIITDEDEDDDEPVRLPDIREVQGNGPKIVVGGDERQITHSEPGNEREFERDDVDTITDEPGTDEINNPRPRGQTRTATPAKPAKTKPKHTRATVPGKTE